MLRVLSCLEMEHDKWLVFLAACVCLLTSLAAVNLLQRARVTDGDIRRAWLATAGIVTGGGVWSTHFIAMLAYTPGFPIRYDLPMTIMSLVAAAATTTAGFAVAILGRHRLRAVIGGAMVGLGIAVMHYMGMASLRVPAVIVWMPDLVAASVLFGVVFGASSLLVAMRSESLLSSAGAAGLLTLAIVSHHFIAMGAIDLLERPDPAPTGLLLSTVTLAVSISAMTAVLVIGGLIVAMFDRRSGHRMSIRNMQLDVALNNMDHGLCMFGPDGRLQLCNESYLRMFRLSPEQVRPGMVVEQLLAARNAAGTGVAHIDQHLAGVRAGHKAGVPQSRIDKLVDGRVVRLNYRPMPNGGWVTTHQDITESVTATEALNAAKLAAEEASRAKSDFLAMMSHEIRTPMAGMMGMIDLLARTNLDEEQRGLAEVAKESSRNLLTVVNNILDFSKLEAGRLTPESIGFSLGHTLKSVTALLGQQARNQGIALEISLGDDVPSWLVGDPVRIGQVLFNLVGNAIKFTRQGSVRIVASHRPIADERVELRIEVIDTGVGIPAEIQAKLFDPFTQADTSVSRKFGGTGLGLAICRQLCRAMGGEIGVDSEPGRGSRFWFTVQCGVGERPQVASPPLQPAIPAQADRLNILVVDDTPIIRTLITKLLARFGCQFDVACDGVEALTAVQDKSYDIVLMDMQMPEMDGLSATAAIRALDGPIRDVPIIALTANALAGQREICIGAGMNDFLTKPIDPDALQAALTRWGAIERRRHEAA
ncbi:putative Histidine kinase [Bradyrhizobium sp. ORS 375]|uniref:ATP-binding protein n=1 Tax=Bradyrhizobium sp. (strain ORS 375) TaxID=566679 RepID=UPI000240A6CB|nr:ATP-binding protein [Bradyrhizobium sp. ORS 375]CCD90557.1 putative Histidine kinase [Bradyrhizobium sp. ORS 375]